MRYRWKIWLRVRLMTHYFVLIGVLHGLETCIMPVIILSTPMASCECERDVCGVREEGGPVSACPIF